MSSTRKSGYPLRFVDGEQRDRVAREAAARGFTSLNAYILSQVDPSTDDRLALIRQTARAVYEALEDSPEFDALDAQLAGAVHPAPGELGFHPASGDLADAA